MTQEQVPEDSHHTSQEQSCQVCEYTKRRLERSEERYREVVLENEKLRTPTLTSRERRFVSSSLLVSVFALIYVAFYHAEIGFFRACIIATVLFTTVDYIVFVFSKGKSE